MIGLLLLLAPFLDAFWARDLGALHRELLENPRAEQRAGAKAVAYGTTVRF